MQTYNTNPQDCLVAYISGHCCTLSGKAAFALTIRRIECGEEVEKAQFVMAAENTTAMERAVAALLLLMQSIQPDEVLPVIIRSGLEYPLKGVTEWRSQWKRRGWKTSSKKPVTNLAHWVEIDARLEDFEGMTFSYQWVPSSANDALNAEVIELAKKKVEA